MRELSKVDDYKKKQFPKETRRLREHCYLIEV